MIDFERVFLVPIMFLLLVGSTAKLITTDPPDTPVRYGDLLGFAYQFLLICFYLSIVILLLVRHDAVAKSTRLAPRALAYVATFLPFLLPFAGGSPAGPVLATTAVTLQASGMAFSAYSLLVLGRSFGVEPQVRRLVQTGPYRKIRHPLYVGEIVQLTGAVLFAPAWAKLAILLAIVALQGYRSIHEERLLEANIPEYTQYKTETKRFIPGIV